MDMDTTTETTLQINEQNSKEKIFKILNMSVPILMGIFLFLNLFSIMFLKSFSIQSLP